MHILNITELFTEKWLRWQILLHVFYYNKNVEGVLWWENHRFSPPIIVKTESGQKQHWMLNLSRNSDDELCTKCLLMDCLAIAREDKITQNSNYLGEKLDSTLDGWSKLTLSVREKWTASTFRYETLRQECQRCSPPGNNEEPEFNHNKIQIKLK